MIKLNIESKSLRPIYDVIPPRIRNVMMSAIRDVEHRVQDITLRAERPVTVSVGGELYRISPMGRLHRAYDEKDELKLSSNEVSECFNNICGYSVYSHLSEIKEGFVTLKGGHRAAVAGTAVVSSGDILNIRDISSISLRVAREVKGCGEELTEHIIRGGGLLLCGSPSSGKTTVLRDIGRLLSARHNKRTSIVDTRGEIASTFRSVSMNDVGLCDVLDGYPREKGIEQAVRCFSPEFIICDEIGSPGDIEAIERGVHSGVSFVASIHAGNRDELLKKKGIEKLVASGAFSQVAFLKGRQNPGEIAEILNYEVMGND